MKLADVITAPDVTSEGLRILREHWLQWVTSEAPKKFEMALELAAVRLDAIAAGRTEEAQQATGVINLLLENVEANAAYRMQATVADGALFTLRLAAGSLLKTVVPA